MSAMTESHADEQPDLVLSPEQSLLSQNLRRLLATRWDIRMLLADSPPSSEDRKMLWRQLDSDMALAGITVPDRCSGSGAGVSELCVVAEAMGRAMCSAPWIGTLGLAVPLLSAGHHPMHDALLERIATEALTVTVARSARRRRRRSPRLRASDTVGHGVTGPRRRRGRLHRGRT